MAQPALLDASITEMQPAPARVARVSTDPLTRSSQLVYDAAGRLTTQTFPGGRAVGYTYDANGNLLSVTPPGRSAHQFSYNASDLPESYTPPPVPGAESPTLYSYNLDRQLTRTTRPDGGLGTREFWPLGFVSALVTSALIGGGLGIVMRDEHASR